MKTAVRFLVCCTLVAGCSDLAARPPGATSAHFFTGSVQVSEAQACAIGYDLARNIHNSVSLGQVVILAPRKASACERHALEYLRRGGFRIDETAQGGLGFTITLTRIEQDGIAAIARIGDDLRIARSYLPVRTGVLADGPVSIQHLNPDTYSMRQGRS